MTTAAYIRVSGDTQDTLRQKSDIEKGPFDIDMWFQDSEGKNPRDQAAKREKFQQMLKLVEAGIIKRIVVDRQDRFGTSNAYQWGKFIDLLREHDCELFEASGKCLSADDDATVLTGTLGAITSRREQKEKAHRNLSGKLPKARAGEYQGGYPPYGMDVVCFGPEEKWRVVWVGHYQRVKLPENIRYDGKGNFPAKDAGDVLRYRPNCERCEIVRQIFEWYTTEAISPQKIANRLNKMGIDAVFGVWNKVKVTAILKNPIYIGLPTWNKRAGSRFSEFVNGKIQDVEKVKLGRRRDKEDYIQPEKPEFDPVVSIDVWEKAQARLDAASKGKKKSPNTSELWLRPYIYCWKCDSPMHATVGGGCWPSYFCGTYNTHGKDNPTGCRCHRVRHCVLEEIVVRYLEGVRPRVAELLNSVEAGVEIEGTSELVAAYQEAACQMLEFWELHSEARGRLEGCKTFAESYGVLYESVLPEIQRAIEQRESQLERLLDDYGSLPPRVKERANRRLEALEDEVSQLKRQAVDLREPLDDLASQIRDREKAIESALETINSDVVGRKKTAALEGVIDRIVCQFRYTEHKSFLEKVTIEAADGSSYSVCSPAPN